MPFKAVLFDLDGTLLDTLEDIADAMNEALRQLDLPVHPTEAYRYFVGDGARMLATRVIPEGKRQERLIAMCQECWEREYEFRWATKTRPYSGIPELLTHIEKHGMSMAVLSNKPDAFTQKVVFRLLPQWRFAAVHGQRKEMPRKPDPAGAVAIAQEIGISPKDIFYIGDTGTDMQTAVAAGMFPVGALWGFREEKELSAAGARELIRQPMDACRFLV